MWQGIKIFNKQEMIYMGLGALFGAFGAHNFYLKQKKRAYGHLILIVASPFISLLVVLLFPEFFLDPGYNVFDMFKSGLFLGFALGYQFSFMLACFEVMWALNRALWRTRNGTA